ncbi:MAG: VanZ family protein [Acidobacteria bacterium]|nr:VanZ family protein [Acidobacteriota bacterium]
MISSVSSVSDFGPAGLPGAFLLAPFGHIAEYAALGFVTRRALVLQGFPAARATAWAIGGAALFGVLDEIHQAFVPMRDSSALDGLTDVFGAGIGVTLGRIWSGHRARASR